MLITVPISVFLQRRIRAVHNTRPPINKVTGLVKKVYRFVGVWCIMTV